MAKAAKPKRPASPARKSPSKPRAPKAAPASAATLSVVSAPVEAADTKVVLSKKTFVDRVMIAAGVNKGQARQMSEAVLKVLGEALSQGEELNVPPLGKLKINRQFEKNGDEILVVKLRRPSGMLADTGGDEKTAPSPLAEDED
ncbi:HU family DNA-binding protein [uncultured Thioclava sp.]|uniref:HU family DNA-binding protein n=1 Tax=uncultured Thioclava sp. TaxID=473858 RepID=UPI0025CCB728|nr:HU family DNA-binding protein [uncultured Thioclava sp.]